MPKSSRGLRGRSGADFPTGVMWELTRATSSEVNYVVCNGDERDPGAVMDRMIRESLPCRVLDAMPVAAFAVGAHEGILCLRAEANPEKQNQTQPP